MEQTKMTNEEIIVALQNYLEHKCLNLQTMEQVTANHLHEYSDDVKEIRYLQLSALTQEIKSIEARIKELTPFNPDDIIPELTDIYQAFCQIKNEGVEKYKVLLLLLAERFEEKYFSIRCNYEDGTPFEYDKKQSLFHSQANELPNMKEDYKHVEDIIIAFDKNSITATFQYEFHNSVYCNKKYTFTYEK